MKNFIIQAIRGFGPLPHVSEHPGTMFLWVFWGFVGIGCLTGAIIGVLIMAAFIAPIALLGAYERANESDYLVAKETLHKEIQK